MLLEVKDVHLNYPAQRGRPVIKALCGVSLEVHAGEILAVVGESGSGKSSLARLIMQLVPPAQGDIVFEGENLSALWQRHGRRLEWSGSRTLRQQLQMVFQNAGGSLDPKQSVEDAIAEPLDIFASLSPSARREHTRALMDEVELSAALASRRPPQLSGGQRQRVALARALACTPKLLVADEPTSALDTAVKGQILALLRRLVEKRRLGLLFVSHDIHSVARLSDRMVVMTRGKIVESGPTPQILSKPTHLYTQTLLKAVPQLT